jgi:hypothetical protein
VGPDANERDRRRTRRIVLAALPIAALSLFALALSIPWWGVVVTAVVAFVVIVGYA